MPMSTRRVGTVMTSLAPWCSASSRETVIDAKFYNDVDLDAHPRLRHPTRGLPQNVTP
jgi:hypothetical protein